MAARLRGLRLLIDEEGPAAWNMAVDEAILDAVVAGVAPPTVRFYRWRDPAISLGRFQGLRGVDIAACRARNVELVRRPTGGRGVLHGGDQTVSIVVRTDSLGAHGASVVASYEYLSRGIALALEALAVPMQHGDCTRASGRGGDCFATRSRADLVTLAGAKLVGSAQVRRQGVLLQQTSVRHRAAPVGIADVFAREHGAESYPLEDVDEEAVVAALCDGFQAALEVPLNPGSLGNWELERAAALLPSLLVPAAVDSETTV